MSTNHRFQRLSTGPHARTAALLLAVAGLIPAGGCDGNDHNSVPATSAGTASFDSSVAAQWMTLLYDIVKRTPLPPPAASRCYAYAGVTLYESVVAGIPDHQSLAGQLHGLTAIPQPTTLVDYRLVANTALAGVIRGNGATSTAVVPGIKPGDVLLVDTLELDLISQIDPEVSDQVRDDSIALGDAIAAAILSWAADDGYAIFHNCSFTPPVGPGKWVPTPPAFLPAHEPCWGQLRTFALSSAFGCAPGSHPTWDTTPGSAFWNEANEVFTTTGDAGAGLTPEQKEIAIFWNDAGAITGTPPGHWISIVAQICTADDENLAVAAEAFAKLGIAVADAFISCWQAKFQYNLERPVTYIQRELDATWDPLLTTPNFAEYTSGHSTQSGAAAVVLTDVFGARAFTDDTHNIHGNAVILPGAPNPRSFADFDTAAAEAAISRLYGGIHYRAAIDNGVAEGHCVGMEVLTSLDFLK